MTLLDLRSESYIAVGDLARASADAKAMKALAKREGGAALLARALCRECVRAGRGKANARRGGHCDGRVKAAQKSGAAGARSPEPWRLSGAQSVARIDLDAAVRNAARAADAVRGAGRTVQQGRALHLQAGVLWVRISAAEAEQAAAEALALARHCGDLFGARQPPEFARPCRSRRRHGSCVCLARHSTPTGRRAMCWPGHRRPATSARPMRTWACSARAHA